MRRFVVGGSIPAGGLVAGGGLVGSLNGAATSASVGGGSIRFIGLGMAVVIGYLAGSHSSDSSNLQHRHLSEGDTIGATSIISLGSSSSTSRTSHAHYPSNCGSNNACNGKGNCFIGKCFCDPGASGEYCEIGQPYDCVSKPEGAERLSCYFHPEFGSVKVDMMTWKKALAAESQIWHGDEGAKGDRPKEHTLGFKNYEAIPFNASLGAHAELGCGPFTQTKTSLMVARPDLRFDSITLSDPNLRNYVQDTPGCPYRKDDLAPGVMTYLVSAGAEAPLFDQVFDTALMTNVLEHVQNGYAVLHQLWAGLKPGGLLIFNDRWVDSFPFHSQDPLNNLLHPVRIRQPVFEHFMNQFDVLYRNDQGTADMRRRGDKGVYFIGRKKVPPVTLNEAAVMEV